MTATDRLSLLQFEHLSLGGDAAAQFAISVNALRALKLLERYEHPAALYLGDIADAGDREELLGAKSLGLGFTQGLLAAKVIVKSEGESLRRIFLEAAERALAGLEGKSE
ncbi:MULTISPECIES: hypothetical protein [Pseudomonas]|uniref:Uncharacterized protein n=1 Tax=Pseudomonas hunanensis TaxID=1247546 RepID=A0ACC6K9V6_9PSED|nr:MULTISPECIES: hypothetical protein [Pseudomonas]MBP2263162.1 hypothetical protein [Pseudomonas sp. BP8]MDR6715288.1 hypothetical protein [Pseudomonas hunanensis]HDS1736279.1 hypothetical protein [Pseudomonas putida]